MLRWGDCPERWLARPDTRASAQTDRLHFAAKYQNIVFAKHCFLKHLATQTKGCSYGEAKTWLSKHCFLFVKLFVASKLGLGLHLDFDVHRRLILWKCIISIIGKVSQNIFRKILFQISVCSCTVVQYVRQFLFFLNSRQLETVQTWQILAAAEKCLKVQVCNRRRLPFGWWPCMCQSCQVYLS